MTRSLTKLEASMELGEKVGIIQQFLESHQFADNGIAYSMLRDCGDEFRPWQPEDLEGKSLRQFKFKGR